MAVKGVFASDQNIPGTRKGDFASALLTINPTGSAPFLALTAGMESSDSHDTVITWFEENHLSGRINVTNNAASGATLVVDDASIVVAGTVFFVELGGEHIYVDSVSGTTLTVTRGFAGTTIDALDGSSVVKPIQRIGTAHEEGSAKPTSIANLGQPRFNYHQIFRNAWDATGTAKVVEYHTGNVVAKNRQDAAMLHAEDIERSLLWGRKTMGVLNSKPFRTMDGITTQIQTNIFPQGINFQLKELEAIMQIAFEKNIKGKPNERICFLGSGALTVLNHLARLNSQMQLTPAENEFGLQIMRWLSPHGVVNLVTHPLMNESPYYTQEMYILHPGAIRTRYLRRTKEDRNDVEGTRAGADADFGVFTSELSVEYKAERTGVIITGLSTAAVDA